MATTVNYAGSLRALGQALEALNVGAFDMEVAEEKLVVRSRLLPSTFFTGGQPPPECLVREIWGSIPESLTLTHAASAIPGNSPSSLELTYSPEDLDRLEREGQARRSNPAGVADAASLSQMLRTVGAYLTKKRVKLLKISRNEHAITVHYKTSHGHGAQDVLSLSYLHDFWMQMYTERSSRDGASTN